MMRVALMRRPGVKHDHDAITMMARGIAASGDRAEIVDRAPAPAPEAVDAVCCWGWRHGSRLWARGHRRVLVLERGYVGDRMLWTSVGWNGLNGRAKFAQVDDGGSRWERHFGELMQPWRERTDGYALIMGQVPSDCSVRDIYFPTWIRSVVNELRTAYPNRLIKFRPHPMAPNIRCDVRCTLGSLAADLSGADLVVTFNSNSGVDAVLAGVPTVAADAGSMAYPVTSHSVAAPVVRPDRTAWAHAIAWAQWLPTELESGESWARLRNLV
jgi:hypothetical protein